MRNKEDFKVEDFVLDPDFRNWILFPENSNKKYWTKYLKENPSKYPDIIQAKKIILNLSRNTQEVSPERLENTWNNIHKATAAEQNQEDEQDNTVPLNAESTIRNFEPEYLRYIKANQLLKLAAVLVLGVMLVYLARIAFHQKAEFQAGIPVVIEDFNSPPGVKSSLTLSDGSKVILNSGSRLRYVKNFESDQRQVELEGEAFFEVAKDSSRPFRVKTGLVMTTAIGTSFNIKAYSGLPIDVSLTTGRVEVELNFKDKMLISLMPGEALNIDVENQNSNKALFNEEQVIAWTSKTIYFKETPFSEIKRVLENWYGVEIYLYNESSHEIEVSGAFKDQTLENVLEGLSYSARFDFEIEKDQVKIYFK
ncbi:ferric-dicitrate binding protein FerR (iron transport regulator) [Algoriphagus sp. 4150]|uniref:FecR family protein n=1 Tax=Algoriphagus sp. 4150 TaxID=2817756 RepID=UPI002858331A|nr:FecR domain-containing protein [Algoriphagus sp. 4150]MDR7131603.1 ferric-dicitrate binding protein FerR (iron transport regulator) [Algoriphagus sp. 4150]